VAPLVNTYVCRRRKNLGHGFPWDLKSGMTVLARASSSLTDRPTKYPHTQKGGAGDKRALLTYF
jgi:hypothetical protein